MADETSTSPREETTLPGLGLPPPRLLRWEIVTVFAVSLGASGIYALVQYIGSLTAQQSLSKQAVIVHGTLAPGRPLLDLFLQITNITLALAPVLLVFYLLARSGERPSKTLGLDASQPGKDLAWGAGLAALIGGAGLGLYLIAYHLGVELNVVAENLPDVWWRFPVLVLSAAQNGIYGRGHRRRLPAEPAGEARRQPGRGHRHQRGDPRLLPPVPGHRRLLRQRGHGCHLRPLLLAGTAGWPR